MCLPSLLLNSWLKNLPILAEAAAHSDSLFLGRRAQIYLLTYLLLLTFCYRSPVNAPTEAAVRVFTCLYILFRFSRTALQTVFKVCERKHGACCVTVWSTNPRCSAGIQ